MVVILIKHITYICCIYNAQNFGLCNSFDETRWYGAHQKMQNHVVFEENNKT